MAHDNGLLEGSGGLRRTTMYGPFLGPFAHLSFDDPGIDAVASWRDDFLGDLLHQAAIPALAAALAGRAFLLNYPGRGLAA